MGFLNYRMEGLNMTKKKQKSKPKKANGNKRSIKLIAIKIPQVTTKEFVDNLKPFNVKTRQDKQGYIGIKINDTTITYIHQRKEGIKLHTKKRNSKGQLQWYPFTDLDMPQQLDDIVSLISDFHKTNDMNVLVKLGFLHPNEVKKE